jgi:hypothetical protein
MRLQPVTDLFQFAADLRRIVEFDNPITQGKTFALGRTYGLRVSTMAGMANCSQSHVRRMLLLLRLSGDDATAIENGAPYTPFLARLHQRHRNPTDDGSEPHTIEPAKPVTWPIAAF